MAGYDVLTNGYVSMDHIVKIKSPAKIGFTALISNRTNSDIYYGGCSVNIAYALSRLGLAAMPVIRVGGDYEQIGFKRFLEEGHVPTEAVTMVKDEKTSICYLLQDNNGQHITLFYPGAMDGIYAKPLNPIHFENARMGVITVGARCDNEAFFAQCKKAQVPLAFGMKGDMEAFPPDFLSELLHYSKIIFTNECEREEIERLYRKDLLCLFSEGNARIIVTTLGKAGSRCYWKTSGGIQEAVVPICDRGIPEDTTGSGDAYISGFLYGHLGGHSVEECAQLGTVLSSFVIEKEGCCTGVPDLAALKKRWSEFQQELEGGVNP